MRSAIGLLLRVQPPGCSASFDVAVRKALQETVQTMIAGAGQTDDFTRWVDSGSPINSLDHRMYFYADPLRENSIDSMLERLKARALSLEARRSSKGYAWSSEISNAGLSLSFVDLTPKSWEGALACVRCMSSTMCPLIVSEAMLPVELVGSAAVILPHPFP